MQRLTVQNALEALKTQDGFYKVLLGHGTLEVGIYKPEKEDPQKPHARDEVYVVASGSGHFINGDTKHPIEVGETLFVPAGVEHRFVDFTPDFSAWVFFYGPEGGESP